MMVDTAEVAKDDAAPVVVALILFGITITSLVVWYFYFAPLPTDLRMCDEAIKAKLKAPATYNRINSPDYYSPIYDITYDAQNSFGVPLRSHGWCEFDKSHEHATWTEALVNTN